MKRAVTLAFALSVISLCSATADTTALAATGEELFKQHCSPCHPNGNNIIEPENSLHKKDRVANKVDSVEAIIGRMRNPGPGMSKFDSKVLPDKDAKAIAEYIMKTF